MGLSKFVAPTAQRVSFFVFLQLTVSSGWAREMFIGDIKNAHLQGLDRDKAVSAVGVSHALAHQIALPCGGAHRAHLRDGGVQYGGTTALP